MLFNTQQFIGTEKPELLWHYTSFDVLKNVLSPIASPPEGSKPKAVFWLTEINYLNDTLEFLYGINTFKEVIESYLKSTSEHSEEIQKLYDEVDKVDITSLKQMLFVLSLSEEKDMLSQWRAYTPNGHGVAIGLANNLGDHFELDENGDYKGGSLIVDPVCPVLYEKAAQIEYAKHILEEVVKGDFDIGLAIVLIIQASCFIKHPSFREEKEWRIVIRKSINQVNFRSSPTHLIPYIEYEVKAKHIKQLMLGPNPNNMLSHHSAALYLRKMKMNDVQINTSSIPYRAK